MKSDMERGWRGDEDALGGWGVVSLGDSIQCG